MCSSACVTLSVLSSSRLALQHPSQIQAGWREGMKRGRDGRVFQPGRSGWRLEFQLQMVSVLSEHQRTERQMKKSTKLCSQLEKTTFTWPHPPSVIQNSTCSVHITTGKCSSGQHGMHTQVPTYLTTGESYYDTPLALSPGTLLKNKENIISHTGCEAIGVACIHGNCLGESKVTSNVNCS